MIVVAHHRISADADGQQPRQLTQPIDHPLATMFVALAGLHAAAYHVLVRRILKTDLT